jgi:adenylate cyclase
MSDPATSRHTFLFTDLVGFTALAADEGDNRAADVALDFYARVRPLLPDHRAEEVKTLGDGLLLRCEDPAEAIRLGVRIVAELEELPGFPPVRVGMHTGSAARLRGVELGDRRLHWLKNVTDPVAAHTVADSPCRSWSENLTELLERSGAARPQGAV